MTPQTRVWRTPEHLAGDLAGLCRVDWGGVWPGYGDTDFRRWAAGSGWTLERVDRVEDLTVRLGSGGVLDVKQDRTRPYPHPVDRVEQRCWRVAAQTPSDNPAVFESAEAVWPDYLKAARGVLGAPDRVVAWDDPEFPATGRWPGRETRLRERRPYRLAVWSRPDAWWELYLSPDSGATTADRPGSITLWLKARPGR